jgi:RecA/RadA recombinase
MLNIILTPFYRIAAIAAVVFAVLAAVYRKGSTSGVDSYVNKQNREAQDAVEKADRARIGVAVTPTNRLRDNDGYRRD